MKELPLSPKRKQTSERKRQANKENATKSTGPRDTGSTRFNALKHGLRASKGITELDDAEEYHALVQGLLSKGLPALKAKLAHIVAFEVMRLQRSAIVEAEFVTSKLHPEVSSQLFGMPNWGESVIQKGFVFSFDIEVANFLTMTQRSHTSSINNLLKTMNQYERLERMENGENMSAPYSADIRVTVEGASQGTDAANFKTRSEGVLESLKKARDPESTRNSAASKSEEDKATALVRGERLPDKGDSWDRPTTSSADAGAECVSVRELSKANPSASDTASENLQDCEPLPTGAAQCNESHALRDVRSHEEQLDQEPRSEFPNEAKLDHQDRELCDP
jgi:hypothetical protein